MQSTRSAVIEEGNFHDSEVSVALLPNSEFALADKLNLTAKLLIGLVEFLRSPQMGGMRIQNIRRVMTSGKMRLLLPVLIVLITHDRRSLIAEALGIPTHYHERLRSGLSLVTLLLFLSGAVNELRPEHASAGSTPYEAESGMTRQTSGDFMGRFLLLESLSSLSFVVLPLLDIETKVKGLIRRFAPRLVDDRETCSSCTTWSIVLPQKCEPCGDIYCYYCVKAEVIPFRCYRCHNLVNSFSSKITDIHS